MNYSSSDLTKERKKGSPSARPRQLWLNLLLLIWSEQMDGAPSKPCRRSIIQRLLGLLAFPDSSNTFMHKQHQVSGAALRPASVRLRSLRTSGSVPWRIWEATGNWAERRLLMKQTLPFMNRGISSGPDFASHFSVSQLCQEFILNVKYMWVSTHEEGRGGNFSMLMCGFDVVLMFFTCLMASLWNDLWNQAVPVLCVKLSFLGEQVWLGTPPPHAQYELIFRHTSIKLLFISQPCVRFCKDMWALKGAAIVLYCSPLRWLFTVLSVWFHIIQQAACSCTGTAPTCGNACETALYCRWKSALLIVPLNQFSVWGFQNETWNTYA